MFGQILKRYIYYSLKMCTVNDTYISSLRQNDLCNMWPVLWQIPFGKRFCIAMCALEL